jgi:hypothetical protein
VLLLLSLLLSFCFVANEISEQNKCLCARLQTYFNKRRLSTIISFTVVPIISGVGEAAVAFNPPANNGGAGIELFTVYVEPGGVTASGNASVCNESYLVVSVHLVSFVLFVLFFTVDADITHTKHVPPTAQDTTSQLQSVASP